MKIAMCYSGLSSRFNETYSAEILSQLQALGSADSVDLYISAWNDDSESDAIRNFFGTALAKAEGFKLGQIEIETTEKPSYNLKHNDLHTWSKFNKAEAILAMFKGIQNADRLRENRAHKNDYDLVIRSRPDIKLQGNVDLSVWDRITSRESLAIFPKSYNWFHLWNPDGGMLCDQFFVAKPEIMRKITDIADEIDEMCDAGCRFHPESLLWWKMRYGIGLPPSFKNDVTPWYSFQDFFVFLRGQVFI